MHLSRKQQEAVNFLHEMKTDLQLAEKLYNEKYYSRSLFSLQLAVEKGIKAQTLFFDIIESEQLHKISHTPTDAYKIAVEEMDYQSKRLEAYFKDDPLFHEFIVTKADLSILKNARESSVNMLSIIKKNKNCFKNLKKPNLKIIQKIMKKKQSQISSLRKKIENGQLTKKDYFAMKNEICEIFSSDQKVDPSFKKKESDLLDLYIVILGRHLSFKNIIFSFLDLFGSLVLLTPLAIISQSHHESTQYPTSKSSPEKIYSPQSNPLIRDLLFFIDKGEIAMNYLYELFDFSTIVMDEKGAS